MASTEDNIIKMFELGLSKYCVYSVISIIGNAIIKKIEYTKDSINKAVELKLEIQKSCPTNELMCLVYTAMTISGIKTEEKQIECLQHLKGVTDGTIEGLKKFINTRLEKYYKSTISEGYELMEQAAHEKVEKREYMEFMDSIIIEPK